MQLVFDAIQFADPLHAFDCNRRLAVAGDLDKLTPRVRLAIG